ncbi:dTDP-4-dehydrorhamnose 3,5-epimerase, partial [Escherichia coli]
LEPYAQAKLVRCMVGEVFDVAVDIRKSSPTFGKWVGVNLSAENKHQLWIPEGFAHGFLVLSNTAEVLYKTNNYYNKENERNIIWNDNTIDIDWPELNINVILSTKDKCASHINKIDYF